MKCVVSAILIFFRRKPRWVRMERKSARGQIRKSAIRLSCWWRYHNEAGPRADPSTTLCPSGTVRISKLTESTFRTRRLAKFSIPARTASLEWGIGCLVQAHVPRVYVLEQPGGIPHEPIKGNSYLSPPMPPYGPSGYHSQLMLPATPIANPTNRPTGMESSMIPGSIPQAPDSIMVPVNMNNTHVAPSPFYVTPPNGLPVNLSHGAVQTECRSVFIGNLPYGTTWKELKEYLEGSTRVEVPRNADNRAKGHAIATFESSEAANQACLRYNNTSFKGRQLRVRMDRHYETKRPGADVTPGVEDDVEDTRTTPETEGTRGARSAEGQIYMPPVVVDGSNLAGGGF